MKKKTLLDQEIDKVMNSLAKFCETPAYDSGVRWVEAEYYLKGLQKAKRSVAKQEKLKLIDLQDRAA